jgi:ectoine hydroxylase-related dioxygenase (phytanoyl-CoA dioxygenase family)
MLTDEQIKQYRTLGYVLVPDVLEPAILSELRAVTERVVAQAAGLTTHSDILDLEPSHTPERPRVRRIKKPQLADPFYRQVAGHVPMMRLLEQLIGPNIRMRPAGKVNMKSAEYGAPVEWHQDWAFYPHTNQDVLAVGFLLDDMTLDNGPLMVLPGSHTGPLHDHHSDGTFCGAIDVDKQGIDLAGAQPLTGPAGAVTIHHARLVHGSALNHSQAPRRIMFVEYAAADAWPLAAVEPLDSLEEFNERVVWGESTLAPRMEDVPVRMPLPRAPNEGSIYENQRTLSKQYFQHQDLPSR